ncbi:hypothetical protein KEM48_009975 [Puccinia striiformis f. sp. tritici PST-130]|nr:hypothetical protein Pst134EB_033362 [Puccinia striiformis f. sp. tritici]KAI9627202.1 hypothetical protein KEM48_009975 [Puccinia striiformis f. sp. tritici PST-130]
MSFSIALTQGSGQQLRRHSGFDTEAFGVWRTNEMAELECKPAEGVEHQQLEEQRDLIIHGFNTLIHHYYEPIDLPHRRAEMEELMLILSVDENGLKDMALNMVLLTLKQLKRLTIGLSRILDPSDVQQATELKFKRILTIQSKVAWCMRHVRCVITLVYPEPTTARVRTDDRHLKRLKSCRLRSLRSTFLQACQDICPSFGAAIELVEHMKMNASPEDLERRSTEHFASTYYAKKAALSIDSTIEAIEGSDWDIATKRWDHEFEGNQHTLQWIEDSIGPKPSIFRRKNQKSTKKYAREPVMGLAKLLIPIIKLSRLFFNKISVRGINTKRLPLFTEMCSEQIESLAKSHGRVSDSLMCILYLLDDADSAQGAVTQTEFIGFALHHKGIFEAPLLVVFLYLIPAIPDTDGFPIQKYYKDWLITWKTQLTLAIENFINFVRSFGDNPL